MRGSLAWLAMTMGVMLAVAASITAEAQTGGGNAVRIAVSGGVLEGIDHDGVVAFLGVPYAEPPVGALRWRPPQGDPHWRGVRRAEHFASECMQRRRAEPAGAEPPVSEDCLYLNIWRPVRRTPVKLPVMVWVHGGAFVVGSASQPLYDGANLARRGVVVVTLNYRLGLFGFFAHPALVRESPGGPIGNYGLLDQIAALRWVRRNIAAFGGNPADVTLFGQSAGGAAVSDLMASPLARGSFERAIIESGIFSGPPTTLAQAESAAEAAARSWGLNNPSAAALRRLAAAKILGHGSPLAVRAGPMIDGRVLPEDALSAFEAGKVAHVPLIIGSNSYEAGFFAAMARGLPQRFAREWPRVEALFDGYGTHETANVAGELATDMMITAPTWRVARAAARAGLPTYLYYYAYLRPSQRGHVPGASHIDEVYAVFDRMGLVEKHTGRDTQRIVDAIESRWVHFALTGRPTAEPAAWPAVTPAGLKVLEFTDDGTLVRNDFASERLALASALAAQPAPGRR
ncbi:MAG TPA: carboxylesterase family protein [Steroidobacteraceae bacterium]|nr:carboxylesterase family protein [Steroidobacteraceae bacterium]